jgi:pimeloyl-ACP methyl ester carboxylesterase
VSGNYNIEATLCHPDQGPSSTLQILTHGIGFDRSYWDFPYDNYNYSYVAEATDLYNYSTFFYDRLGIGQSSHGEPVNEIQSPLEIAALQLVTTMLRNGTLRGCEGYKASKTIHVGHSFGSIQSYSLTVLSPELSDGLILTGFSQNTSFSPYFELGGNFISAKNVPLLANYPTGYLAAGDASGVQTNFFSPGDFDPAVLALATSTGQPVTPGELLTEGALTKDQNPFTGPVLIITGGTSQYP